MRECWRLTVLGVLMMGSVLTPPARASETTETYTNRYFLYSADRPSDWRVREISKVALLISPLVSKDDKFAENVNIVAEDLSKIAENVTLVDYYRKSVGNASKTLNDFKLLEEAQTQWIGRDAVAVIYTATLKGEKFKFKAYTVMVDKTAYVLTFTAAAADFDEYLPVAERIMRSLRVSP